MKKTLIVASIVSVAMLAMTGCESTASDKSAEAPAPAPAAEPAMSSDQVAYNNALAGAKAEKKKAAAMGGEWRDIGKLLKKAEAAASKGDYAKATKLANEAAFQAKMGQAQAAHQAGVGNPAYLYY